MSDAAYAIVCEDTEYTGNFLLDEHYLRDRRKITDFRGYQLDQSISPEDLMDKINQLRARQRQNARHA